MKEDSSSRWNSNRSEYLDWRFEIIEVFVLQQNKILYDDKIGLTRPQQAVANQVANKVARQYA